MNPKINMTQEGSNDASCLNSRYKGNREMMAGNGEVSVPPGFRFHPTDEELLYYYLRKKVCYEAIDLDVIREIDLNRLEPWDLKEKCRIGSGPQNEWYFFSHKDKKYPTGTRTNRATRAGFWKATGRDKAIHLGNSDKRIGMRKTLVFYTGRAPHGHKTDWIMHEYRLEDDDHHHNSDFIQEDGWVVCRVFKKKNQSRGFPAEAVQEEYYCQSHTKLASASSAPLLVLSDHHHLEAEQGHKPYDHYASFVGNNGMHLPQLFSPEHSSSAPILVPNSYSILPVSLNAMEIGCSQNLLRLTSSSSSPAASNINNCGPLHLPAAAERLNNSYNDWSFLDKLLASHQSLQDHQQSHSHNSKGNTNGATTTTTASQVIGAATSIQKFSIPWL